MGCGSTSGGHGGSGTLHRSSAAEGARSRACGSCAVIEPIQVRRVCARGLGGKLGILMRINKVCNGSIPTLWTR